jgi:hexosaminidase
MDLRIPLAVSLLLPLTNALQALPPISWSENTNGAFTPTSFTRIYVSAKYAHHRDSASLTLTPPSVFEFAQTFFSDLHAFYPELSSTPIELIERAPRTCDHIFLGLLPEGQRGEYVYEDGSPSEEGFRIQASECGVEIMGAGARGVWWGTRALLQTFLLDGGVKGMAVEMPAVLTRGFMLDAGRKWYSADVSCFIAIAVVRRYGWAEMIVRLVLFWGQ